MTLTGVSPKPLESKPELSPVDYFYLNIFNICGDDFSKVAQYCSFSGLNGEEILEAMEIMTMISREVN